MERADAGTRLGRVLSKDACGSWVMEGAYPLHTGCASGTRSVALCTLATPPPARPNLPLTFRAAGPASASFPGTGYKPFSSAATGREDANLCHENDSLLAPVTSRPLAQSDLETVITMDLALSLLGKRRL